MRTRAFGPTQGKTLPTPGGARSRPVTNLASLQSDTAPDFTATPRPQTQPYAFTPISQLPGGAPSTGEEGGEAPPSVGSAPLLSPSALSLSTLQRRVAQSNGDQPDTGPTDVEQGFDLAGKALKGVKGGVQTAAEGRKLLARLLGDAGYGENLLPTLEQLMKDTTLKGLTGFAEPTGGALNPNDFTFDIGALDKALPELGDAAGGAAATAASDAAEKTFVESLGQYAPYLSALTAALQIGQTAASDAPDNQKVITAVNAAGTAAAGAGLAAAGAAPLAAPVAMILSDIASAIIEASRHIPHAEREGLDYFHSRGAISGAAEDIDKSFTLEDLNKNLIRNTSGYLGGGYPGQQSAFMTELNQGGNRRFLGTGTTYPTVTLADLLADPQHTSISWQHGLSSKFLDPTNANLTNQLRARLTLLDRAQKGDPEAMTALKLARARYSNWVKNRDAQEQTYEGYLRGLDVPGGGNGNSGDASGGPGGGGGDY